MRILPLLLLVCSVASAKTISHHADATECINRTEKIVHLENTLSETQRQLEEDKYVHEIRVNELRAMRDDLRIIESGIRYMQATTKEIESAADMRRAFKVVTLSLKDEQFLLDQRITEYDRAINQFEVDEISVKDDCYEVDVAPTVLNNACFGKADTVWCQRFIYGPVNKVEEDTEDDSEKNTQ